MTISRVREGMQQDVLKSLNTRVHWKQRLKVTEEWVEEMIEVLNRSRASESILQNLTGLLTDEEIADHRHLLLQLD